MSSRRSITALLLVLASCGKSDSAVLPEDQLVALGVCTDAAFQEIENRIGPGKVISANDNAVIDYFSLSRAKAANKNGAPSMAEIRSIASIRPKKISNAEFILAQCFTKYPKAAQAHKVALPSDNVERTALCYFSAQWELGPEDGPADPTRDKAKALYAAYRANDALTSPIFARHKIKKTDQLIQTNADYLIKSVEFGNLYSIVDACPLP